MFATLKYAFVRLVAGHVDRELSSTAHAKPVVLTEDDLRQVGGGGGSAPRGTWARSATGAKASGDAPRGTW